MVTISPSKEENYQSHDAEPEVIALLSQNKSNAVQIASSSDQSSVSETVEKGHFDSFCEPCIEHVNDTSLNDNSIELDEAEIEIVFGYVSDDEELRISAESSNVSPDEGSQPGRQQKIHYGEGIRLVTLSNIFDGINSFSHEAACHKSQYYIIKERILGAHSDLTVGCHGCRGSKMITTTRQDVNELLTLTSMSAGLHYTGLSKILTPIGCPVMAARNYDRIQHGVGHKLMKLALGSCRYWAEEEKRYSATTSMPIVASYQTITAEGDSAYAKRSKGTNYSSLSGGAVIMGNITKKIIDFEVCQAYCLTCKRAQNQNRPPSDHDCPWNFEGKASNMEPELITRMFNRSLTFNGTVISKFIADGDASVLPALRREKVYMDLDVHVKKIRCRLHILRNFIRCLREIISHERLNNSSFKNQLIRSTGFLEGKLLSIIDATHEEHVNENQLKQKLGVAVRHHFGRHNLCPATAQCQIPSDRQIISDTTFDKVLSAANTSLLCYSSSLIENCDTNQVESFNNKQSEVTSGKRLNLSSSWSWIYRWALSVLAWNSSDQDAVAIYLELAKGEKMSNFHEELNLAKSKKRFRSADYERPDHAQEIRTFLEAESLNPISFDPSYTHPYAMDGLSAQRSASVKGPGYSSTGNSDREDLEEAELYQERDRVLKFLLRAHAIRHDIALRTVARHDSEEYTDIRSRLITSDKISIICKYVDGSKETRVASWHNKLYSVLGTGGVRYSDRFIKEEEMREKGIRWLETERRQKVTRVGTLLHHQYPFLEGNPVGFIGEKNAVEIFYFYEKRMQSTFSAGREIKWLMWEDASHKFSIKPSSDEYAKIQGDLAVSACNRCVVILMTDVDQQIIEVKFDKGFFDKRLPILADFFYYCLYEQADPMKSRLRPPRLYSSVMSVCESSKWRTWP